MTFDRYDVLSSLKSATRSKRQGTQEPIYYHITGSTHIAKVTLKKLISHTKTKAELTAFLAQKVMERGEAKGKTVVVAWATECKATYKDVSRLQSDHGEADTKIIFHALDATADGATELSIYSPDTDVLVLAIRSYSEMYPNTSFVTGSATTRRTIKLQPILEALGSAKTAALPAFPALTGADNTGTFSGKGKPTCWKEFEEANESILRSLANLAKDENPTKKPLMGLSNSSASCTSQKPQLKLSKSSGGRCLRREKLNQTDYHQLRQLCTKPYYEHTTS